MNDRTSLFLGGLLALLTFSAYVPAMRGAFIWDDDHYVAANPLMTAPDGLRRIWSLKETDQYYPLTFTSFWLERRLWGLEPMGYHLVNVALHAANALLVWLLLRRLKVPGAWLAGAIFALHPVHVESVAWITERKNVLSGMFYLLALGGYLGFEDGGGPLWYCGALGAFLFSLLSKTATCAFPFAPLLIRWGRGLAVRRRDIAALLPFFALAAGMSLVTAWTETHHAGARGAEYDLSALQRVLLACRAAWFYPWKLILPVDLAFSYGRWALDVHDPSLWSWAALSAVTAAGLWRFKEVLGRGVLAGIGYFALTIAPALGFFTVYTQRYSYVADHYQYLASVGLIAVAAGCAGAMPAQRRRAGSILSAVVIVFLWTATWRRAHAYRDSDALWRDTLLKSPRAFLAHNNLGVSLAARGRTAEAIAHYREALAVNPDYYEAHDNLGLSLLGLGMNAQAGLEFREALRLRPDSWQARNNLGSALGAQGKTEEAIREFRAALRLKPDYALAGKNLDAALAALAAGRLGL